MIKTQPVADGGSLVNRVKNKLSRITIRTLRAPYFYPDPLSPKIWSIARRILVQKSHFPLSTNHQAHIIFSIEFSDCNRICQTDAYDNSKLFYAGRYSYWLPVYFFVNKIRQFCWTDLLLSTPREGKEDLKWFVSAQKPRYSGQMENGVLYFVASGNTHDKR